MDCSIIEENSKNDLNFKKKLELSYQSCLNELTNPIDWEKKIKYAKYEIDTDTGNVKTYLKIPLKTDDKIEIKDIDHTYIFKRSHFYKNSSRLRSEYENIWNKRGYYVQLYYDEYDKQWMLKLNWKH